MILTKNPYTDRFTISDLTHEELDNLLNGLNWGYQETLEGYYKKMIDKLDRQLERLD